MKFYLAPLILALESTSAFYSGNGGRPVDNEVNNGFFAMFTNQNKDEATPTRSPNPRPTQPSSIPTLAPSIAASDVPTSNPTSASSDSPSSTATDMPTTVPLSDTPSSIPTPAPSISASDVPTSNPTSASSDSPSSTATDMPTQPDRAYIPSDELPAILTETRTSSHRYQWGSTYEGCDHDHPPVYLSCGGGGFLTAVVPNDAICEQIALDRIECKSTHDGFSEDGAFVDFHCSGITSLHLAATAEVFPSKAKNCDKAYQSTGNGVTPVGGNAAIFGVLGRFCSMDDGAVVLEEIYSCEKGRQGVHKGVSYCAEGGMCTIPVDESVCSGENCEGVDTCEASIGAIQMSNTDDRLACSESEQNLDLMGHEFDSTTLGSFHSVEWFFSGSNLGCSVEASDAVFTCQDGGEARLGGDYLFCVENASNITCTNPNPESVEERNSVSIKVWCHGDSYDQLQLAANLAEVNDNSSLCSEEGMAIQGLRIKKGCSNDELISSPNFCSDESQLYTDTNLCYAGYFCSQSECEGPMISVPAVSSVASDTETRQCVRAA